MKLREFLLNAKPDQEVLIIYPGEESFIEIQATPSHCLNTLEHELDYRVRVFYVSKVNSLLHILVSPSCLD